MKSLFPKVIFLSIFSSLALFSNLVAEEKTSKKPQNSPVKSEKKLYRHVVLFQFKKEATESQVKAIEEGFAKLPSLIDTIQGYEWGLNVSPEGLDQDLTHVFLVTFEDQKGFETYLHHSKHLEFVEQLKPILEKAVVLDYVAQ